ncbi:MAG: hypothetical protein OXM55_03895 [Bdellovibrionales bacterium]|nr:hypothetical protein [Bdellovibrionales bacterium]
MKLYRTDIEIANSLTRSPLERSSQKPPSMFLLKQGSDKIRILLTILLFMPFLSVASINLETQSQLGPGDLFEPWVPYIKVEVQKLSFGTEVPKDVGELPFVRPFDGPDKDPYEEFPPPLTLLDKRAKEAAVDFCLNNAEVDQDDCIQLMLSRVEQCRRTESLQVQIKCLKRSGFLIKQMEMAVRPWDPDDWPYLLVPEPYQPKSQPNDDDDEPQPPLEYASKDDEAESIPFIEELHPELIKPCSPDSYDAGPGSGSGGGGSSFGDSYDGACFF